MDMPERLPPKEDLEKIFRALSDISAFDEAIRGGISQGALQFFYFPVTGQEAIAASLAPFVRKDDNYIVTYRGFHHQIVKGVPFAGILGEMTGKETGLANGKSGPMHICVPEVGMMFTSGMVGGTLPPATGLALASKMRGDDKVTICALGDGAINTGAFHESINLAAIWELPVIFICENNKFSENTDTSRMFRGKITDRAGAYDIAVHSVDGYDPIALHAAYSEAFDLVRNGKGPVFIEAECFRYFGHYFGDAMLSVPKEQLEAERERHSIPRFTDLLVESGYFSADELSEIREVSAAEAKRVVEATVAAAPASKQGLLDGTYANPIEVA